MSGLYVQTSGNLSTNASQYTPIPGLSLTLPAGNNVEALVTLNLPNPYAQGNNFPGANIGIAVNGTVAPAFACFTYGVQQPQSFNRMPTTLVIGVALAPKPQVVQGMWCGVRGSTVMLDSPATLSAVV